jgi:hypothetical protein
MLLSPIFTRLLKKHVVVGPEVHHSWLHTT